jgi:hypothetical protein
MCHKDVASREFHDKHENTLAYHYGKRYFMFIMKKVPFIVIRRKDQTRDRRPNPADIPVARPEFLVDMARFSGADLAFGARDPRRP